MPDRKPTYLYLVYDNDGDWPVCVDATAEEAADMMGIKRRSLIKLVNLIQRHGECLVKWTIMRRKPGEEYKLIKPDKKKGDKK